MFNSFFFDNTIKFSFEFVYYAHFIFSYYIRAIAFKKKQAQSKKVSKGFLKKLIKHLIVNFFLPVFFVRDASAYLTKYCTRLLTYSYFLTDNGLLSGALIRNRYFGGSQFFYRFDTLHNRLLDFISFFFSSGILFLVFSYVLAVYNITPFLKIFFSWFSFGLFGYILVSGFVFFFKKYSFSKYTDVIQRFWKRSFSIFWLLEGTIFLIFIYLTLNSSSEVFYSFDAQALIKMHLGSLRIFFFKLVLINTVLILLNFLLVACQNSSDNTIFSLYILISGIILYITWIEFYQFYIYLQSVNFYSWIYLFESYEFALDADLRRSRTLNNYMLVCVAAKFWHFVFIIFVWFFYLNRYLESTEVRFSLLSASIQNFLILYVLNLIVLYPYFKLLTRRYLNVTYKWFFSEFNEVNFKIFSNFLVTFYSNLF